METNNTTFAPEVLPGEISVVIAIPTRNRGNLITETLHSLLAIRRPNILIVVVDQSTDPETGEVVKSLAALDPRLCYLSTRTVGSSTARNLAAYHGLADIIAYLDDDCIADPSWIDALLQEFQDPKVAAVYGRLLPYEGGRNGREVGFKDSQTRTVFQHRNPPWHIGHGGNMAFRRCCLLAVGGFDPFLGAGDLFGAGEDGDIAYRFLAAQKCVVYTPHALVYHKHWKNWASQQRMERCYGIGIGAQFAKYIRCGDRYGWQLLATWIWQLGFRRFASGLLKWRDTRVMYLGYCQLLYPWIGILKSRRHSINKATLVYRTNVASSVSHSGEVVCTSYCQRVD